MIQIDPTKYPYGLNVDTERYEYSTVESCCHKCQIYGLQSEHPQCFATTVPDGWYPISYPIYSNGWRQVICRLKPEKTNWLLLLAETVESMCISLMTTVDHNERTELYQVQNPKRYYEIVYIDGVLHHITKYNNRRRFVRLYQ